MEKKEEETNGGGLVLVPAEVTAARVVEVLRTRRRLLSGMTSRPDVTSDWWRGDDMAPARTKSG